MKKFNTTGTCFPSKHYMVDISERIEIIRGMVENGDYFCINRGRHYGKTTTLEAVRASLSNYGYTVFSLNFGELDNNAFSSLDILLGNIIRMMQNSIKRYKTSDKELSDLLSVPHGPLSSFDFIDIVNTICYERKVVLLIDETDQARSYYAFVKFLAVLRSSYLNRDSRLTFQSVVLAGVHDIKNLEPDIRPDREYLCNSPWNIAAPFDIDMSLHADGIAEMLAEYKADHNLDFDEKAVAQEIYDYTGGYPFLVSRLCQIIDDKNYVWSGEGVVSAVHDLLNERNTLFDDLVNKLEQFPELKDVLKTALFTGNRILFNPDKEYIRLAESFNFISKFGGNVTVPNRILETRLYNLFTKESEMESIYTEGSIDKNQFIVDGMLNMRHLLERFAEHYRDIYGSQSDAFKEKEGRRLFLLYLKPIINGVGNYYVEAETRDETRTDIVIDYLGHQYVIELKIWRGNSYNERGEKQLAEYLDYFHLETGYLVSFCFNKNKQVGVREVAVGEKKVFESVV